MLDVRAMRRACTALVRDLKLPMPAEPAHLITALCDRMGQRIGRPVHHRLVRFPPGTVSGMWLATDSAHFVLCEERTSGWHQLAITGHEFWHMEAGHPGTPGDGDIVSHGLTTLNASAVSRILARRTDCTAADERRAELFASIMLSMVSRWLPHQTWTVPADAATGLGAVETTLEHRRADGHG